MSSPRVASIMYKLWRVHSGVRAMATPTTNNLAKLNRILFDSSLLHTITVAVFLVTVTVGSNALFVVSDINIQIIVNSFLVTIAAYLLLMVHCQGINFNVFLVRAHHIGRSSSRGIIQSTVAQPIGNTTANWNAMPSLFGTPTKGVILPLHSGDSSRHVQLQDVKP